MCLHSHSSRPALIADALYLSNKKKCKVSPLLGDQNRKECQKMQNLAIASEKLRRGCSCASKVYVKPND